MAQPVRCVNISLCEPRTEREMISVGGLKKPACLNSCSLNQHDALLSTVHQGYAGRPRLCSVSFPIPSSAFLSLATAGEHIDDLVTEEVEDKNTHRGQKTIYLYQL